MNNALPHIPGYQVLGLIGKGGMAEVYAAIQTSLKRKVAIKILLQHEDQDFQDRFINEGFLIASLLHPSIITLYDISHLPDGRLYLAMEFIGGGDLAQHQGEIFPPERALQITLQIAQGLQAVHEKGLIHRDIKPANILFRSDDQVVITDFGIAKDLQIDSNLTQHGIVVGSPSYSSPEQAQCHALDARTDIYSLGVILLELLTGTNPFRSDNYTQTVLNHVHGAIPKLPKPLSTYQPLLNKMLAKKPEDRFSDCQALINELQQIQLKQQKKTVKALPFLTFSKPLSLASLGILLVTLLLAFNAEKIQRFTLVHYYLYKAERQLEAKHFIDPPENNADYFYHQTLKLEPSNNQAMNGLKQLTQARIHHALEQAENQMLAGNLLQPKNENALRYYREVISLDSGNKAAKDGLHRIALYYLEKSKTALANNDNNSASDLAKQGLLAEPNNKDLLRIRNNQRNTFDSRSDSSSDNANPFKKLWQKIKGD